MSDEARRKVDIAEALAFAHTVMAEGYASKAEVLRMADVIEAARDQGARSMDARVAAARAEAIRECAAMLRAQSASRYATTEYVRTHEQSLRIDALDDAADDVEALAAMELAGQPAPDPARTDD